MRLAPRYKQNNTTSTFKGTLLLLWKTELLGGFPTPKELNKGNDLNKY